VSAKLITLHQFGRFTVDVHGTSVDALSRKTKSILAYLASAYRTHSRAELYNMFCQNASDPAGTLRWHLSRLRRLLHKDVLLPEQHTVTFNHEIAFVDSLEFQSVLLKLPEDVPSVQTLQRVLLLHRGEYLEDIELRHAPEFDFWLTAERTRLNGLYENGLLAIVDQLILQEDFLEAVPWTQRLLHVNPLLESGHFRAVWLYARLGQRGQAVQQFENCRRILRDELAVELSGQMKELQRSISDGTLPPPNAFLVSHARSPLEIRKETVEFVGRDSELKSLLRTWNEDWKYTGGVLLIHAVAGGGKTRLALEFVTRLPKQQLLRGRCHESSRRTPYYPWIEILETSLRQVSQERLQEFDSFLLSQLSYLLPSLASHVNRSSPLPDFSTTHFSLAVFHFLLHCNNNTPLALLVDDLQWADAASLSLFQFIGNHLAGHDQPPLLLIGTYRTEEKQDNDALLTLERDLSRLPHYSSVALEPLTPEAVGKLIAQKYGDQIVNSELRERIVTATGCNPLYVTEILNEMSEDAGFNGSIPVPPSIRELVQRRMRQLPTSGQQVMEAVAVVNRPVPAEVFQAISGRSEDEVFEAIDAGLRWHLLRSYEDEKPIQFGYFHDLLRDAIWGQLNGIRKQRLHKRAAQTLALRNAPAAQLVYHWNGAGDMQQEAHYAALAGREAADVFSYDDANLHLQRALELTTAISTRADLLIQRGLVLFTLGEWDAVQATYEEALEIAGAQSLPEIEMKSLFGLGQLERNRGLFAKSIQYMERAAVIARKLEDHVYLSSIIGGIGSAYWRQGEHGKALIYQEQALSIALEHDDVKGASMVHGGMGVIYANLQEFEKALFHYGECLKIAEQRQDRNLISKVMTNMAIIYARQNDLRRGLKYFLDGLLREHDMGDLLGTATALNNIATVAKLVGAYTEAKQCTWYALQVNLRMRNLRGITLCLGSLGDIKVTQKHYSEATDFLAKAITLGKHLNLRYELTGWLFYEAERLAALNLTQQALSSCREALSLAEEVSRDDIGFRARLLEITLKVVTAEMSDEEAQSELTMQLAQRTEPEQQAMILDTISQLHSTDEAVRLKAAEQYKELYQTVPNTLFRDRYMALAGKNLSQNTVDVVLPHFIIAQPIDENKIMREVEEIIEQIPNS